MSVESLVRYYATESGSREEILGKVVNHIYRDLDCILQKLTSTVTEYKNYALIDLGNIHNVLKEIDGVLPYTIYAFADKCFNGYGVNPKASTAVTLIRAHENTKNAADIHIIWTVAQICFSNTEPCNIHVITKDKGFLELQELARTHHHHLYFHISREKFYEFIRFTPNVY